MNNPASMFNAYYYQHNCGNPYERNELWLNFFLSIAKHIKAEINPQTVLDAGCAKGFLVEGFRQEGISAFGVDISDYAIQDAHESIKPFVWQGSITQPLKEKYDLIVSIEVVEHMSKEDAIEAIGNLCQFTDDILFSSTPFDYKEATHFNVQMPDYWMEQFARHGFFRDVDFDASFITPWAVRLRRQTDPFHRIIRNYDRKFWILNKENLDLRQQVVEMQNQIAGSQDALETALKEKTLQDSLNKNEIESLKQQVAGDQARLGALQNYLSEIESLKQQVESYQARLDALQNYLSEIDSLKQQVESYQARWDDLQKGVLWRLLQKMQGVRLWLAPRSSLRERWVNRLKSIF